MLVDASGAPQENLCLVAPVAQALPSATYDSGGAFTHFVGSNFTWDALADDAQTGIAAQTPSLVVRAPDAHVHVVAAIPQTQRWMMMNTNPATAAAEPVEDGSATGNQVQIEAGGAARLVAALQKSNEVPRTSAAHPLSTSDCGTTLALP